MSQVKVIAICMEASNRSFRRKNCAYPEHPQEYHLMDELLTDLIHFEEKNTPGLETDIIVVNSGTESELLNSFDSLELPYGTLYVRNRPNIGWSFGAYDYAFQNFKFDWWLFTEDDLFVGGENYYQKLIDRFNSEDNVGFVGIIGTSDVSEYKYPIHCHGGVGLTTGSILTEINNKLGYLPHFHNVEHTAHDVKDAVIQKGEIPFTNEIYKLGYKLIPYSLEQRWGLDNNLCQPYTK